MVVASIYSFNFSTLCTNISHNKLSKVLCEIIEFCFKVNKTDFIIADKYGTKRPTQGKDSSVKV